MTPSVHGSSATIYEFSAIPRRRSFARAEDNITGSVVSFPEAPRMMSVIDTCWYHEEAVKESDPKLS